MLGINVRKNGINTSLDRYVLFRLIRKKLCDATFVTTLLSMQVGRRPLMPHLHIRARGSPFTRYLRERYSLVRSPQHEWPITHSPTVQFIKASRMDDVEVLAAAAVHLLNIDSYLQLIGEKVKKKRRRRRRWWIAACQLNHVWKTCL